MAFPRVHAAIGRHVPPVRGSSVPGTLAASPGLQFELNSSFGNGIQPNILHLISGMVFVHGMISFINDNKLQRRTEPGLIPIVEPNKPWNHENHQHNGTHEGDETPAGDRPR